MKHNPLKELFTGRRNIFTVMIAFLGGYFIAYPLVQMSMHKLGEGWTILIGMLLLIVGDYMVDAFHKSGK